MPRLLFIAHAPSPNTIALREAVVKRITDGSTVDLITKPPLETHADDALAADAILIATTENIGAMAGLTKDFFDRNYNDLLEVSAGTPVALYIRAGLDGTGTRRGLESIFTGLGWRLTAPVLILRGQWDTAFCDEAGELGLGLALGTEMGLY